MTNSNKPTFSQFREQELKKYTIPDIKQANDWQDERAIQQRQAFVEHDIKRKWQALKE